MSSPIAKANKTLFDKVLIGVHKRLSHNKRVVILADLIADCISQYVGKSALLGLDVGCGDMRISELLMELPDGIRMTCTDLYDLPVQVKPNDPHWNKYVKCADGKLPFEDRQFNFAICVDVLHHIRREEDVLALLTEAKRVSSHIVIKDHIEMGWPSRQLLRAMDFVGNYGYGVSIPKAYFSKDSYCDLIAKAGLQELAHIEGVSLYDGKLIAALGANRLQFISVLRCA